MIRYPFEDKKKTELRERCAQAVDIAGYALVDPLERIEFPPAVELKGVILGDLQCRDSEGNVHVFHLRTASNKPVPGWLQNQARAALALDRTRMYVVVDSATAVITQSCRACGAGLLELAEDGGFRLVLQPGQDEIERRREKTLADVRKLRRLLEAKIKTANVAIETEISSVTSLSLGLDAQRKGFYLAFVEEEMQSLREWGDHLSERIDAVQATLDENELAEIREAIERGFNSGAKSAVEQ